MTTGRGSGDSKGLGRWVWGAGIGFFVVGFRGCRVLPSDAEKRGLAVSWHSDVSLCYCDCLFLYMFHLGPTTRRQETTAGTNLERVGVPRTRRGESLYRLTSGQLGHSAGPQQYRQGGVAWRRLGSSGRLRADKEWKVAAGSPPVHHWPRPACLHRRPPPEDGRRYAINGNTPARGFNERSDRVDQTSPPWWAHLVPGSLYLLQMRIHPAHRPPSPIIPVALDIAHRPS